MYINFREWTSPAEPADTDISEFIRLYLRRLTAREGKVFLDQYYDKMLKGGLFFFILDSFDEMPAVLDADDSSPRLKRISEAFDRFFRDLHSCRGVLAPRPFQQPVDFRGRRMVLRPFRETQIRKAFKRWLVGRPINPLYALTQLFRDRPHLIPTLRSPFTAELIAQHLSTNQGSPRKVALRYSRAIWTSVCVRRSRLYPDVVLETAAEVTWLMYSQGEIDLEASLEDLSRLSRGRINEKALLGIIAYTAMCAVLFCVAKSAFRIGGRKWNGRKFASIQV